MNPFVPGFQHDVFISYSHLNDSNDWVKKFRKTLHDRLAERVPPGAVFFHDKSDVQGNEELTPEVVTGIRKSAVLVSIVSKSYITRPWCQRECVEFLKGCAERGVKGCIFPVRYDDVSPGEFQKHVGELLGYEFFAKTDDGKYGDTLEPDSPAFKSQMHRLRVDIADKLTELKAAAEGNAAPHAKSEGSATGKPVIFLANPAIGLAESADQLKQFLKGYDYDVIEPGEGFYKAPNFEAKFAEGVKRSLLFVQLLGRKFDPYPADNLDSWDRWQFQQAQKAGVPTLQWFKKTDSEGNEIDLQKLDQEHRTFVTDAAVWNCEMQRFRDLLKTEMEKRFHAFRQKQERTVGADGRRPFLILRSDRSDKEFAEKIGQELGKLECEWVRVPDKDATSLEVLAQKTAATGLMVIYRACPGDWVLARLQEVRRFLKSDIGKRWSCGLWREPEDEDALSMSVDGVFVIEPKNPVRLQEFMTQLKQRMVALDAGP